MSGETASPANPVALVTHVNAFVGLASADALARSGMTVVCHDPAFTEEQTRTQFADAHPDLRVIAEHDPADMAAAVTGTFGRVDVLVNNDPFPAIRAPIEDARGGANALAVSLARELAAFNIQVNAVAPNFVESPTYFPPQLLADPQALGKITRNIPLGRLGKPREVGELVAFLASGEADFITGHVMPIAGGWA